MNEEPPEIPEAEERVQRRNLTIQRLECCGQPVGAWGRSPKTEGATRYLVLLCDVCGVGTRVLDATYRPFTSQPT